VESPISRNKLLRTPECIIIHEWTIHFLYLFPFGILGFRGYPTLLQHDLVPLRDMGRAWRKQIRASASIGVSGPGSEWKLENAVVVRFHKVPAPKPDLLH
jgi:hypothetical protein